MSDDLKAFNQRKLAAIDRIRHDGNLSASIRTVGAEVISLVSFETGDAWPSEAYLAEKLSLAPRTVKMAIAALKAAGYVVVTKRGRSNRYRPTFENEQGQILPLSQIEQGQNLPLSEPDRGKFDSGKGQKTSANRGKKRPPISLEISLRSSGFGTSAGVGAPDGADAPTLFDLGTAGSLLRETLGAATYQSWLAKIAVVSEQGNELTLSAPTKFIRNYVVTHFENAILDCWRRDRPEISRLKITVREAAPPRPIEASVKQHARWLIDVGRDVVSSRMYVSTATAELTIVRWLQECGNDAEGLAAVISSADQQNLTGDKFRNVVNQRMRELLNSDQPPLALQPVVLKRSNDRG